jgi:type VI secretion system protein
MRLTMPLTLRIQTYRKQAPEVAVEKRFDGHGGTIGRGEGSDLQLPDPAKYISRTHCKLDFAEGRYTLVDLGSNPSWINERPLGTGKVAVLNDGDLLTIGDYVLHVALDQAPPALPVFAPAHAAAHTTIDEGEPGDLLAQALILETGAGLGQPGADDPLGLNLGGHLGASDPLAFRGSEPDHVAPQFVAIDLPPPAPPAPVPLAAPAPMLIPEDYDPLADLLAPPAPAVAATVKVAPAPAHSTAPAAPGDEVLRALLRGLGLPELQAGRPPAETAELVGAMLREATAGTMSVLLARAMTKRESRLELTVIGAQANNPLKFFPDAEGALAQMLANAMPGYMPPLKAFAGAFDDLRAHEMAVIAGMRAALAGVLERFNPAVIEARMEPEGALDKLLGASRKARMWEQMVEQYGAIAREAEDDFQRLFGERFSAAYEDQIGRLNQGAR